MAVSTASGSKISIGSTEIPPNMENISDPAALAIFEADSYIEIGEVENLGEYGDQSEDVTFASLNDSRTRHYKGTRDAGVLPLTVGDDAADEGQIALIAAEASHLDYNFRVELNNAQTLSGDNELNYFYGKVMSKRRNVGDVNNVIRGNYAIGINSRIVVVEPT